MNETENNSKHNKYFKAVGAVCFPLAAVCISVAVILIIDFVKLISVQGDENIFVYFMVGAIKFVFCTLYLIVIIIATTFSIGFIWSGIALIKQSCTPKTKHAITLSFIGSLVICLVATYPFIKNTCRIIAHGYQEQYYLGFWLGLLAFAFSTICLVFNRITAKKCKSIIKHEQDSQNNSF